MGGGLPANENGQVRARSELIRFLPLRSVAGVFRHAAGTPCMQMCAAFVCIKNMTRQAYVYRRILCKCGLCRAIAFRNRRRTRSARAL